LKALRFLEFGDPNKVLHVDELPTPKPANGSDVIVEITAAGINPSDVKNVQGGMHHSSTPRTPGRDFSGTVIAGPAEWLGKEVWGTGGDIGFSRDGTHAQFIKLSKDALSIKPASLSHEQASTSALTFVTAYLCFLAGASAKTGSCVVIGAAGGVGNAAMQICKWRGIDVVGLVRKQKDADQLNELGLKAFATDAVEPEQGLEKFGLDGADMVIDTVGGTMFNVAFSILKQHGRIVEIASPASMRTVSFDMIDFYHREATLIGVDSRSYTVEDCAQLLRDLHGLFAKGISRTPTVEKVSLDQAIAAYAQIAAGQSSSRFTVYPNNN
jgi:NADPH:quinone reductase